MQYMYVPTCLSELFSSSRDFKAIVVFLLSTQIRQTIQQHTMNMEMKKGFTKKNGQYFRVTKEVMVTWRSHPHR